MTGKTKIDIVDRQILHDLQEDGRISASSEHENNIPTKASDSIPIRMLLNLYIDFSSFD